MDPSLRKTVVASMAAVDEVFDNDDPNLVQLHIDERTALVDAVEMDRHMLAGIRASDAFQVFNPEVVARKMEAEAALRAAMDGIDISIREADQEIAKTKDQLVAVERALARGPDAVRVGPSINRRAVDRDHVIFPSHGLMPDEGVAPPRRMTMNSKLRSRGLDAKSQTAFWEVNLVALQKEALLISYRDGLREVREQISKMSLEEPTYIGCDTVTLVSCSEL